MKVWFDVCVGGSGRSSFLVVESQDKVLRLFHSCQDGQTVRITVDLQHNRYTCICYNGKTASDECFSFAFSAQPLLDRVARFYPFLGRQVWVSRPQTATLKCDSNPLLCSTLRGELRNGSTRAERGRVFTRIFEVARRQRMESEYSPTSGCCHVANRMQASCKQDADNIAGT